MTMNNGITTRIAMPGDMQDLARLNNAFNEGKELPEDLARRLADPACVEQALIAEVSGRVVGFAGLRIVPCVFYADPHGELTELYVEKEYRRLGVARALVRLAEKLAVEQGVKELVILTGGSNQAARSFYRSLGYEEGDLALGKELRE